MQEVDANSEGGLFAKSDDDQAKRLLQQPTSPNGATNAHDAKSVSSYSAMLHPNADPSEVSQLNGQG